MPLGVPVEPDVKLRYSGSVSREEFLIFSSLFSSFSKHKSSSGVTILESVKIRSASSLVSPCATMTAGDRTEYIFLILYSGSEGLITL